jgi:hypothetical protein
VFLSPNRARRKRFEGSRRSRKTRASTRDSPSLCRFVPSARFAGLNISVRRDSGMRLVLPVYALFPQICGTFVPRESAGHASGPGPRRSEPIGTEAAFRCSFRW